MHEMEKWRQFYELYREARQSCEIQNSRLSHETYFRNFVLRANFADFANFVLNANFANFALTNSALTNFAFKELAGGQTAQKFPQRLRCQITMCQRRKILGQNPTSITGGKLN